MLNEWREHNKPPRLERRYTFSAYSELREFLDRAADISETMDLFPDLSFGREYVNVTIHGYDEGLTEACRELATKMDELREQMNEEADGSA